MGGLVVAAAMMRLETLDGATPYARRDRALTHKEAIA